MGYGARDVDGQILGAKSVDQADLILDRPAMQTVATDWLQWDVGGASDNLLPSPSMVYLDDAAISLVRLGPDTLL